MPLIILTIVGVVGGLFVVRTISQSAPPPEKTIVQVKESPLIGVRSEADTQGGALAALKAGEKTMAAGGWDAGSGESAATTGGEFFDGASKKSGLPDDGTEFVAANFKKIDEKKPSVSVGPSNAGALKNAAELPPKGFGYQLVTSKRERNFGTDALVSGLIGAAAQLKNGDPEAPDLGVGDLSAKKGGEVWGHISHENGRDVDLVMYRTDAKGKPLPSDKFISFDGKGRAKTKSGVPKFDTARNWALVKSILTSPILGDKIQFILVSPPLEELLLKHAKDKGEDPKLIERAKKAMLKPSEKVSPHDDHFHLRIKEGPPPKDVLKA